MKSKMKMDYAAIEKQVRRAHVERAAYLGELIGSGLLALGRIVAHPFASIARARRPKERLAPR